MADEPFYKGKRLTVMINYGAGGPADIEARMFARHIGKHIDGNPAVIVQNIDGAGGLIGTTYLGEIAPKDGTMMGHLTGMAWRWANDADRFRVDFKTYEFIGYQRSTTVYFMRTDVPPGMKQPADIVKAQGVVSGGLGPDNAKDLLIRLGLEMLGVPHKHVTSYRSSATRGWRCSRARSISFRNRRRAIAVSSIPASSRRVWQFRSGTIRSSKAAGWSPRSRCPISASRRFRNSIKR